MGIDHGGLQIDMAEQFLDAKRKSDFSRPEAYENSNGVGLVKCVDATLLHSFSNGKKRRSFLALLFAADDLRR
jgi:hypothetical protein